MYSDLIEICSLILSCVAFILVVLVFVVNVYFRIRKSFPITVNCWFCNSWTKVCYENRNSFDCPTCLQYNGFTKDGSYNKVIEAQHDSVINKSSLSRPCVKSTNGFCDICNHNQQLKIIQLANFTPLIEGNYDVEIEHFKNQLEKAYQLCNQCTRVLRSTLLREKASIFGNHVSNIQKKGLNLYLKKSSASDSLKLFLIKIFKNIQGSLGFFVILSIVSRTVFNNHQTPEFVPTFLLPYFELCQDLSVLFFQVTHSLITSFSKMFMFNMELTRIEHFSLIGLVLQSFLVLIESSAMTIKVNQILCWSFLAMTSWTTTHEIFLYTHLFQIFCASIIFYNSFYEFNPSSQDKKCFKKLSRSTKEEWDEYSDDDISSQSVRSYPSFSNELNSSYNSSFNLSTKTTNNIPPYKTETDIRAANNLLKTSSNTASNLNRSYSNIRTSLENLHLGNSTFNLAKTSPVSFRGACSPLLSRPKLTLSPPELKTVTQNSWVAGGFWKNEDGTIVRINEEAPLSRSSSQSSGFGSQINENVNTFNNPFHSLPTSRKTSLCGEVDRFSLASEPPYHFHPISPPTTWNNAFVPRSPSSTWNCQLSNPLVSLHNASNQSLNELVLPAVNRIKSPLPLYSTKKPLGLFKLPQSGPSNDQSKVFTNREFTIHPTNPFLYDMKSGR